MNVKKGLIVKAIAGRDNGKFFVVIEIEEGSKFCYIADGDERKLASPKRKSLRHLRVTSRVIDLNDMLTDKKLREVLKEYRLGG